MTRNAMKKTAAKKTAAKTTGAKKSAKSKGKGKPKFEAQPLARFARNTVTGKPLEFVEMGAYGGRGARTSAIENAIAKAGARGLTIAELREATHADAVEMHVRNLLQGNRPHFVVNGVKHPPITRRFDESGARRGAIYFDVKYAVKGSKKSAKK